MYIFGSLFHMYLLLSTSCQSFVQRGAPWWLKNYLAFQSKALIFIKLFCIMQHIVSKTFFIFDKIQRGC